MLGIPRDSKIASDPRDSKQGWIGILGIPRDFKKGLIGTPGDSKKRLICKLVSNLSDFRSLSVILGCLAVQAIDVTSQQQRSFSPQVLWRWICNRSI